MELACDYEMSTEQAKKLRETAEDEFDEFDDDFSDEEITEEEIAYMMNRPKNMDDIADTISMRSEADDADSSSIASQQNKKFYKLKSLVQTIEMFSRRAKNDRTKVWWCRNCRELNQSQLAALARFRMPCSDQ